MEKIIDVFWGLILMGIIVILGISFAEADAAGQAARRYKEDVVSEIENSNFSDDRQQKMDIHLLSIKSLWILNHMIRLQK